MDVHFEALLCDRKVETRAYFSENGGEKNRKKIIISVLQGKGTPEVWSLLKEMIMNP